MIFIKTFLVFALVVNTRLRGGDILWVFAGRTWPGGGRISNIPAFVAYSFFGVDFAALLREEAPRWIEMVQSSGLKID